MSILSNVIAAKQDFLIQRGANHGWFFQCKDGAGELLDWSTVPEVKIDVIEPNSRRVLISFTIGDGLTVHTDPTYLLFQKWASEKDLPPGDYAYDLKVPITELIVEYPVGGSYKVVDNVTK